MASAIAYFMTALFFFFGFFGLVDLALKRNKGDPAMYFFIAIGFFAAAWGCAYLGGI